MNKTKKNARLAMRVNSEIKTAICERANASGQSVAKYLTNLAIEDLKANDYLT